MGANPNFLRDNYLRTHNRLHEQELEVRCGRDLSIVVTIRNGIYDYYTERWLLDEWDENEKLEDMSFKNYTWDEYLDWARHITTKLAPGEVNAAITFMKSFAFILKERLHQPTLVDEEKVEDFVAQIMDYKQSPEKVLEKYPGTYTSIYDPKLNRLFLLDGVEYKDILKFHEPKEPIVVYKEEDVAFVPVDDSLRSVRIGRALQRVGELEADGVHIITKKSDWAYIARALMDKGDIRRYSDFMEEYGKYIKYKIPSNDTITKAMASWSSQFKYPEWKKPDDITTKSFDRIEVLVSTFFEYVG